MPKKKTQHKKDIERGVEQLKKVNAKDIAEEYTTVVDYEAKRERDVRKIGSNWSACKAPIDDFECDEKERTQDFSFLVKNASSDCAHFELSSEKLWKKENLSSFCEIFNLDLNILSKGLACLPFYERIDIDVNELSLEEKAYFDEEAVKNWELYQPIIDNFQKKLQVKNDKSSENDHLEKTKNSGVLNSHIHCNTKNPIMSETKINAEKNMEVINKPSEDFSNKSTKPVTKSKAVPSVVFNSNENLEDWLDSVLDD